MPFDVESLVGQELEDIGRQDFVWWFVFPAGCSVTTETFWRVVTDRGVVVTSEDDGERFGLNAPFDSTTSALDAVKGRKVIGVRIVDLTADLIFTFDGGVRLEFLSSSSGYESWHLRFGAQEIICLGGGRLHVVE